MAAAAAEGTAAIPTWSEHDVDLVAAVTLRQGGSLARRLRESRRLVLICDGYEMRYGLPLRAFQVAAQSALAEAGVLAGSRRRCWNTLPILPLPTHPFTPDHCLAGDADSAATNHPRVILVVRAMADTHCVPTAHAAVLKSASAVWVPAGSSAAALRASGVPDRLLRLLPEHCPYSAASTGDGGDSVGGGDSDGGAFGGGVDGSGRFTFLASVVGVEGNHFARKGPPLPPARLLPNSTRTPLTHKNSQLRTHTTPLPSPTPPPQLPPKPSTRPPPVAPSASLT